MPELPEVETVARLIRPGLVGRAIRSVDVRWHKTIGALSPRAFEDAVVGARVASVTRRAKYVALALERRKRAAGHLLVHLRMSGRLHVEPKGADLGPHVRLVLGLDRGALYFIDVRKFGRCEYKPELESTFARLGPEPLGPEFDAKWLRAALRRRKRRVKPLLLDQSFLAGLGNIYVDEALFRARIHPLRRSDRLPADAVRRLAREITATLSEAVEREGSSFDTFYRTPEGQPGSYQEQFRVYGREGRPCRRCGAEIQKLFVGQRGTHVCPRCQRPPRRP